VQHIKNEHSIGIYLCFVSVFEWLTPNFVHKSSKIEYM